MTTRHSSTEPAPTPVRSLAKQIRGGLLAFVILTVLGTATLLIALSFHAQRNQLYVAQRERSRAAARDIDAYLDDVQRKLGYLGRVQGLTNQSGDVQQRLLEALTRHNDAYEALAIVNNQGIITASVAPYGPVDWQRLLLTPEFDRALQRREDVVSVIEQDQVSRQPLVTLAIPVRNEQDQVAGVLMARVNLKFLWFVISEIDVGQTGYAYILDQRHVVVAEKGNTPETFQPRNLAGQPFVQRLTETTDGSLSSYSGLRDVEVLGASALIPSMSWYVVVELPTSEAYAPVQQLLVVMGLALVAAMLVASAAGVIVARRIVTPLQQLTSAAKRMSTGDLQTIVPHVSGVNQNELGILAHTFNQMARQLQQLFQAQQESERRFRAIFNQTFQLIGLLKTDGTLLEANQTALEFAGVHADDVIGRPYWEGPWWHTSESRAQLRKAIADAAHGQFVRYEVDIQAADGSLATIDFSLKPVLDDNGNIVLLIPEGRDITDTKRVAEAMQRLATEQAARTEAEIAQRRFAFLAEASALLSASLDDEATLTSLARLSIATLADWCVVDVKLPNGQLRRIGAHREPSKELLLQQLALESRSEVHDQHPTVEVLHTGKTLHVERYTPTLLAAIAGDEKRLALLQQLGPQEALVVPLIARGTTLGVISFVSATLNRYGPPELSLAEELARRAAVAIDNARLYGEAQAALRVRDTFLSIAAHELRTPITSLLGNAQLLSRRASRDGTLAPRDQRSLSIITSQAERLNRLIRTLLDISRIERGQLTIERQLVDLRALVRRLVDETQANVERHTLIYSDAEVPVPILGDALRLEQVLQNLIGNAIKYSPNGGTINIALERENNTACITVADQGIGIPVTALPQLFQQFYRAGNAEAQQIGGMGIGLYVVKEIVNSHGGEISVTSIEGQGSVFIVHLPLHEDDQVAEVQTVPALLTTS